MEQQWRKRNYEYSIVGRGRLEEAEKQRQDAELLAQQATALDAANFTTAADQVLNDAVTAEQLAAKTQNSANQKPANLASVRSGEGMASLRVTWASEIVDRAAIDLEKLRSRRKVRLVVREQPPHIFPAI